MFVLKAIAIYITKKPALFYGKIKILTIFNSSMHNHMFLIVLYITSVWYNFKNCVVDF